MSLLYKITSYILKCAIGGTGNILYDVIVSPHDVFYDCVIVSTYDVFYNSVMVVLCDCVMVSRHDVLCYSEYT